VEIALAAVAIVVVFTVFTVDVIPNPSRSTEPHKPDSH
jgi:hypothetical protein